jgi:peptidyl-prolyl cis-trans isomerase SurA
VLLAVAAAFVLTACQPSAGTAAYVGSDRITEAQLQAAVSDGLAQPGVRDAISQQYRGDLSEYRRSVLFRAVQHRLATVAALRTGVRTNDADVSRMIDLEGGFARLRTSGGLSAAAAVEQARDQLLTIELGYTRGGVPRPSEEQLRAAYRTQKVDSATAQLGLLALPDADTARRVLAQLKQDPSRFTALAARYLAGSQPDAAPFKVSSLNQGLREKVAAAAPGTFLSYSALGADGGPQILVIKVYRVDVPTFEQLRLSLSQESLARAYSAGQDYLAKLAQGLGVRVNPRYGTWNARALQIDAATNPVLTLTGPTSPEGAATVPNPGGPASP